MCDSKGDGAKTRDVSSKTHKTAHTCDEGDPSTYLDTEAVVKVGSFFIFLYQKIKQLGFNVHVVHAARL